MDPSKDLGERLAKGCGAVFFSATLLPVQYYKEMLSDTAASDYDLYVDSPFAEENRLLVAATDVSSRYTRRGRKEYERMAAYIRDIFLGKHCNYMGFFPSYQLMKDVFEVFTEMELMKAGHGLQLVLQESEMSEDARQKFLDAFQADAADAVIVATGSETLVLPFIKGITAPEIVHGGDCLSGKRPVGHKVLVVGGGMVGAETADFLAEQGHEVSVIEMRDAIGPDVIHEHRVFLMEGLKEYDVHQYVDAAVSEIYPDGVSYKNAADKSDDTVYELRGFDTVVLSMGYVSKYTHREGQEVVYDFVDELKAICPEVHVVGDAIRARRALDATKEAYDVALNI